MRHPTRKKNGFTLIEVIVSLLLLGILSALGGMFLVAITQGYVFSQQNNETALKAQVALAKIVKEIGSLSIETDTITAATATAVTFRRTGTNHTLQLADLTIQFDGITLVDNVTAFGLTYFDNTGAVTATLANIRRVDITLSLRGAGGVISNFAASAKIKESYY
jgi:prepilin-type N-terminal cleavage/methylation domain-containing protein